MFSVTYFLTAFSLLALATLADANSTQQRYCGIALTSGFEPHRYYEDNTVDVLRDMRSRNANYVQISAYARQVGINSLKVDWRTDPDALAHVFRAAKRAGLGVFFKPVIDLVSPKGKFVWRGYLKGTKMWFDKVYNPYILSMAKLAEREGVEIMAIGSEYRGTLDKNSRWVGTIKQIRKVYSGKLTYIGNHDSYWRVKFWRQLDFISISAYFKLVSNKNAPVPSYKRTVAILQGKANEVGQWRTRAKLTDKRVLVAEIGYQSKGGLVNYISPWDWEAPGKVDRRMQARMYEIFLTTFLAKKWVSGVMLWNYELDRNAGNTWAADGYTPQNKPAQWVMKRKFRSFCG